MYLIVAEQGCARRVRKGGGILRYLLRRYPRRTARRFNHRIGLRGDNGIALGIRNAIGYCPANRLKATDDQPYRALANRPQRTDPDFLERREVPTRIVGGAANIGNVLLDSIDIAFGLDFDFDDRCYFLPSFLARSICQSLTTLACRR